MSEIGATAEITSAYQNQRVNPLFTGFSKSILSQIDQRKLIDHVRNHRPSKKDTLIPDVKSNEDITFRPLIYKIEFNKQTYIVRKKVSQISWDQDNHLNIRDQLKINKLLYNYLQKCIKKRKDRLNKTVILWYSLRRPWRWIYRDRVQSMIQKFTWTSNN